MGLSAPHPVLEPDNGLSKISRDLKELVIFLLDHPEICTDICEVLGVSLASVKRWRRNIWDFDNVHVNPNWPRASRKHLNEEKIDQMVHLHYMPVPASK
jgi:hypothetical protein